MDDFVTIFDKFNFSILKLDVSDVHLSMNDVIFNSASLLDWIRCISLEKLVPNPDSHYDPMTSKTPR